tara:strand:+ start:21372 stop:21635 length:264 start_codon:yes stop_codon:yes gene_type:complete
MASKEWKFFTPELCAFIFTVLIVLASISATYGISQHRLDKHEDDLQDLNTTVKEVETDVNDNENLLIKISNDVKWIVNQLKKSDGDK